jgi:hypothetical protein
MTLTAVLVGSISVWGQVWRNRHAYPQIEIHPVLVLIIALFQSNLLQ